MAKKIYTHLLLTRLGSLSPNVIFLFVILFICLAYSNTLHSPLVLDDRFTFIDDPKIYIDDLSFDSLQQLSSTRFGLTRLIPILTFAIDHLIGQGNIIQYHLTNTVIHIFSSLAVYLLIRALCRIPAAQNSLVFIAPESFSLFVTALWALHPLQTNAVTYLVQRMASLTALFYFAALACYIAGRLGISKAQRTISWCGLFLFSLCAFLSKENSLTLPLAILLIELLFISPGLSKKILVKIKWYHLVGVSILLLVLSPLLYSKLASICEGYSSRHFTIAERLLTELRVIVFYLSLLAVPLPSRLNLEHDFSLSYSIISPPTTLIAFLFLASLLWIAFKTRRQNPLISFGILFFFLNLIIESSIISLELVFEHRLYLPSLGFFIVAMALVDLSFRLLPNKQHIDLRQIIFLGVIIITSILSIFTSIRNAVWQDEYTIISDCAQKSPNKPRVLNNLGIELASSGRYDEGLANFEKTIALGISHYEEYIKAASNIVNILIKQNKFQEAADRAEKYLRERPKEIHWDGFPKMMLNLGIAYWKLDKLQLSFDAFVFAASSQNPTDTKIALGAMEALLLDAQTNENGRRQLGLGNEPIAIYRKIAETLITKRDYHNTDNYLRMSMEKNPNDIATLKIRKDYEDALEKNAKAIASATIKSMPPTFNSFRFKTYLSLAGFIEKSYHPLDWAVEYLLKAAVRLEPINPIAGFCLARWYLKQERTELALKVSEQYLRLTPDFFPLLELSAFCYQRQKNNKLAAIMFGRLLENYPGHPNWPHYERFIQTVSDSADQEIGSRMNPTLPM